MKTLFIIVFLSLLLSACVHRDPCATQFECVDNLIITPIIMEGLSL